MCKQALTHAATLTAQGVPVMFSALQIDNEATADNQHWLVSIMLLQELGKVPLKLLF